MLCANMTQSTSISEGEAIQTSENMPKTRTIPDENTAFFQKRHRLSGCLPYSARLEETRRKQWHQLKEHFSSALLEGGHSLKVWIKQMDAYLSVHRFAFSKTEHIQLVTGLWSAVQHLDDDLPTMAKVVPLLNQLLSKPHLLTRDDLQEVDWRSLYRLFLLVDGKHPAAKKRTLRPPIGFSTDFRVLIRSFKLYFAVSATAEVLDHFKPKLCVYGQNYATVLGELDLFLPTAIIISSQQKSDHELWFTGLLRCWFQNPLESKLENLYVIFFSEVAKQLNGHLDWEPYLPQIFDRLRHLMTTDSDWTKVKISIFTFIVYLINEQSSALEKMKALYSSGSAGNKLLSYSDALTELLEKFVQRARAERKAVEQGYWYFSTPPSHRLTPELIDHFAEFIFDEVIFERLELGDSGLPVKTLNKLALLCTETFARRLLFQKWALAVERASEPDRKRSVLKLMAVFLYPVLKNRSEEIKSAYANQMDSLLVETLSSLSTTDEQFAYYQLLLLRSIIWLKIGGVHCASSFASSFDWNAFTESFIGVCFILVESNCETMFSTVNGDDMKELIFEILQYSLAAIEDEEQCSNHIDRIISFVFGQITDQRHAMRLLSEMLYVVMGANRHETVQLYAISKILLTLKTNIFSAIDNEAAFADTCQSQLMHNLRLLQTFFNLPDGRLLLRHETEIIDLLTTVYDLQFDYHFKWSNVVFSFPLDLLFFSLNCFYLVKQPYNFTMASFSGTNELLHQVLPEDLPVRWHTPSEEEINFVRRLLKTFIGPQIQFLQNFVASSSLNSAKEPTFFAQLEKAIMFLVSLDSLVKLKNYKYPPLVTDSDDSINEHSFKYHNLNNNCCLTDLFSLDEEIDLFGKQTEFSKVSNFSFVHELIKLLTAVSTKLRHSEINVDISFLLENITDICNFCLFPNKVGGGPSLATHHTRTEHVFTADLFKPAGDHRRLPPIQAQRLNDYNRKVRKALQVQSSELVFTAAHQVATTHLLLDLALDQSSEVRQSAQSVLNSMWTTFPGTFERYAVPRLLTALTQYESNYEAFKGALYVLFGRGTTTDSPLISGGWREILLPLWPALLAVNWAEKPAIAFFVDDKLIKLVYVLRTHPIVLKEDNFQAVKTAVFKLDQFFLPSEEQCFKIEKTRKQISLLNECSYLQLIESLLSILNKQKLHWRFYQLGMDMLITLIRFDIPLPETAVEFFLSSLIHDSKKIRDDAVLATNRFLFQHCRPKRKLLKMNDSSYRSLDCLGNFSADQTYYEKTVFIDYFTEGFQVSPDASFEVHAPDTAEQCSQYSLVVKKFTNEKFLDTFFHLMIASIDEAQEGNLKCDWAFVKLWKYLFQSFKLFNNHLLFFSRIEAMLNKKKLAAECKTLEVLVGLAKAMPWFSYEDLTICKQFFEQVVFEKHLKKFDAKADSAWFFLFYGFFQNRDLRRSVWVWRGLFEGKVLETFGGSSETDQVIDMKGITVSPITISSWINWSKSAVKRNWRFPLFNEQVVRQLENGNFLSHPYKDVRVEIASLLSYLFRPERLSLSLSNSSITKSRQLFVKNVVEKLKLMLSPLLKLSYSSSESFSLADEDSMLQLQKTLFDRETENGQELLQLLDTVGRFVDACLKSIYYADGKDFFPLLPYFCVVHTNNTDPIDDTLLEVVGLMAKQLFSAEDVRETGLLSILEQISSSRSTNTRKMAAGFMISFTAKNAFVLREDNQLKKSWLTILLKLLFDEHLTVRLFAQKAMLYVWQLVLSGKTETRLALIEEFKEILKRKNSSPEIREKHGAILGLCALVEATPDSVPNYLPSLLLYLRGWIAEPQPVSETIKSTLRSFRASHIENWVQFKKAFTEEQLNQLDSVLVSNFYFT